MFKINSNEVFIRNDHQRFTNIGYLFIVENKQIAFKHF